MGRPHIPSATGGDGSPMTVRWRDNVQRYWGVKSALEVCATSRHGVGMCTRGELIHTIATMRRDTHGCRVMGDISSPMCVYSTTTFAYCAGRCGARRRRPRGWRGRAEALQGARARTTPRMGHE